MITMHARPRQTDGQTDKHHDNSATIVLRNTSCAKVLGSRYRVFQKLDREADKQKHRRTRPKTLPRRTRGSYDTKSRHAVHGIYRSRRNVKITVFTASFIYCDFFIVPIVAASTACALQFSTSITRIQHNCHSLSVRNHNRRPCNNVFKEISDALLSEVYRGIDCLPRVLCVHSFVWPIDSGAMGL